MIIMTKRVLRKMCRLTTYNRCYFSSLRALSPSSDELKDEEDEKIRLPFEWYQKAYPKLIKMAHALRHLDQIDGRVLRIDYASGNDDIAIVNDDNVVRQLLEFKTIAKAFIGLHAKQSVSGPCFSKPQELNTTVFDTLTKVCNFLYVSAQQRKSIRVELCRRITHQNIWRGALEEVLNDLLQEISGVSGSMDSKAFQMGRQIISCCIKFLKETGIALNEDASPLWAQLWLPPSVKKHGKQKPEELLKWEEVATMFQDLTDCLEKEERIANHLVKVEAMKERLYQMKNIIAQREIGYNEARHVDLLVQKRLSLSLGHSSKCLFTLLTFYLFGSVRDIEVEACGLHGSVSGGQGVVVYVGKVLASDDERIVRRGVKQLDRALGVIKFVWELAEIKGALELQGHLWCVGVTKGRRIFKYRGKDFFLHRLTFKADAY